MARSKHGARPQPASNDPAPPTGAAPSSSHTAEPSHEIIAGAADAPIAAPSAAADQPISNLLATARQRLRGTDRTLTVASTAVTLIGGILALIFLFLPQLRPDEPAAALGAQLEAAKLESGVSLGDYWSRRGDQIRASSFEVAEFSDEALRHPGVVVTFQAVIEGYQDQACSVRWSMFTAESGQRVTNQANLVDQPGWPAKYITPTVRKDQVDAEIWVPAPADPGPFFVRLELLDPNGVRLASLDSPTFAGVPRLEPTPTPAAAQSTAPLVLTPPVFGS